MFDALTFAAVVVRVRALSLGTHAVITSVLVDAYSVQAANEANFLALVNV